MSIIAFRNRLKEHKIALFLAVCTALIVAFPQVFFRIDHPEFYQEGIEAIEMLPDSPWSARVREVQDGYTNWGSIYFKDGKDDPYIFQPLGSIVVAHTGTFFGLGINNTLLLSRIVFPFITFMLMYTFVFLLSRNKWAALTSTSAVLLAESLLSPWGLLWVLRGGLFDVGSPTNFLELARPVNSAMIFIFYFGFLVTFWLYLKRRMWQWGVVSSIILGLNFYNYFYSWTHLFAFGGVLVSIFLLQREWTEIKRITYVYVGAILVATPYLINLYSSTLHPGYEDVGKRLALIASHEPAFIGAFALLGIIVFLIGFPRKDWSQYVFGLSLLLTPFITVNQQILTGKVLQASHYHWYIHKPLAVMFVIMTIFYLLHKWSVSARIQKYIAVCIIVISFSMGLTVQLLSYYNSSGRTSDGGIIAVERQKYAPVMHWLNENAERDSVVFANEETSHVTVIYTPLNVFHEYVAHAALVATHERMLDILFTYYRLRGVDQKNVTEMFHKEEHFISTRLYGLYYREVHPESREEDIPQEVFDEIVDAFIKTLGTPTPAWLYTMWQKYEVEHIVWDREVDPDWKLEQYPFLEEMVRFGEISIFRVQKISS